MNARALLSLFRSGHSEPKKLANDFPPEAYSYDGPIDKDVVAAIQAEHDKKFEGHEWTVTEQIEDVVKR